MRIINFLRKKLESKNDIWESLSESEKDSAETLYNYLNLKMQNSVNYEDLHNLYYTLFCTLDVLPDNLKSLILTKEVLAITFVRLARQKNVNQISNEFNSQLINFSNILDENHWIEQIRISMLADKQPNRESARILLGSN